MGAKDDLHRSTEATLIDRWATSAEPSLRALAAATRGAREVLLQRRQNAETGHAIYALREEIAALESKLLP